ncbi:hypothetical protein KAW18_08235 [candidate division WOR-3 bacterium]|nr:hypothetical protein [candidate division WOR-3 bacterium]MCK4527346.1 hypothetical protein [candidate division WOR-3 bacterium]
MITLLLLSFCFEPTVGVDFYEGGPGVSINGKVTVGLWKNVELDFNLFQIYFNGGTTVGLGFFSAPEVNIFLPTKKLDIYAIASISIYDELKGLTLGAGIRIPINKKFAFVGECKYIRVVNQNILELMGGFRIPFTI